MKELTLELTDCCPHECSFCSSLAGPDGGEFLPLEIALEKIRTTDAEIIHISGGEPVEHPNWLVIFRAAKAKVGPRNVRFMSNEFPWIAYNAHVLDGIRVEANLTIESGLDQINVLKRVSQGREATQPVVKLSRNHGDECSGDCGHKVVRPDGTVSPTPCRKDERNSGEHISLLLIVIAAILAM